MNEAEDENDLVGKPLSDVPKIDPDEKCNGRKFDKQEDGSKIFKGYCKNVAGKATDHLHEGRCSNHGGASDGAPEDNENAVGNDGGREEQLENEHAITHGAFSEHFMSKLSETERNSVADLANRLGEPESAKETGVWVASEAYHKYLRSGDDRFLARFESLCKTFGIAEDEVMKHLHAHQHEHSGTIDHELTSQERADLNAIVDSAAAGPAEIEVEPVGNLADGDEEIIDVVPDESDESNESESSIEVNW